MDGAYFTGKSGTEQNWKTTYGYTHIGSFGEYRAKRYEGKWIKGSIEQGEEFTEVFTKNIKSLRYLC